MSVIDYISFVLAITYVYVLCLIRILNLHCISALEESTYINLYYDLVIPTSCPKILLEYSNVVQ